MDKFLSNFQGGLPLNLDDFRWFLSQSSNKGIYAYFDELQRDFGNDLILQGCVVTGSNPNKSLTEGWILLGGEVLKVDAIAGTLDTSTDSHYIKFTTFDASGQKTLRNSQVVQTYEKARGKLDGTSGDLKFDGLTLFESQGAIKINASNVVSQQVLRSKVIFLQDWNMDSTASINLAHGLTGSQSLNIVSADAIIRDDSSETFSLNYSDGTANMHGGIGEINSGDITLLRVTGGFFDTTQFEATSFNRGFIYLVYMD